MSHGHTHADHHHPHPHAHGDVAAANRDHFDKTAHTYDDQPGALEAARRVSAAMLKLYPFNEDTTTVLDYACGTGLISRELAPRAKKIVGVDISQAMVDQYNLRVSNQGIPPDEMKAVRVELKGEPGELDGEKFDVIVCSLAYHHFSSIEDTTRVLAALLNPAGALLVADILTPPPSAVDDPGATTIIPEDFKHAVPHRSGFDEATMRATFESAGLTGFSLVEAAMLKNFHGRGDIKLFVAKGSAAGAL